MNFNIITIFPEALEGYFDSSILKRARENKLIKIKFHNPRDFAKDKHKTTDDKPFGGGPGMIMKVEPLARIISKIKAKDKKIIILSPAGKQFTQKMAKDWAKKYKDIVLISGRYEGIDERVKKIFKAQEISIGPFVLTGGELPAAIIVDAVSRHIPRVLGKQESLEDERGIGIPVYTRPEVFEWPPNPPKARQGAEQGEKPKKYRVPKVLLSGHHKKIQEWRSKRAK